MTTIALDTGTLRFSDDGLTVEPLPAMRGLPTRTWRWDEVVHLALEETLVRPRGSLFWFGLPGLLWRRHRPTLLLSVAAEDLRLQLREARAPEARAQVRRAVAAWPQLAGKVTIGSES